MPRLLVIIETHGPIRADSERAGARKALAKLHDARKLGRSIERREKRMLKIVGSGIQLGFVSFSAKEGVNWTEDGKEALARWRARSSNRASPTSVAVTS